MENEHSQTSYRALWYITQKNIHFKSPNATGVEDAADADIAAVDTTAAIDVKIIQY